MTPEQIKAWGSDTIILVTNPINLKAHVLWRANDRDTCCGFNLVGFSPPEARPAADFTLAERRLCRSCARTIRRTFRFAKSA